MVQKALNLMIEYIKTHVSEVPDTGIALFSGQDWWYL